jgi:hypothetical protein
MLGKEICPYVERQERDHIRPVERLSEIYTGVRAGIAHGWRMTCTRCPNGDRPLIKENASLHTCSSFV